MKFSKELRIYGDMDYRGPCPSEDVEQVTFFNRLRRNHPDTLAKIAMHPKNEGKRTRYQMDTDKAKGLTPGASDIIIPGSPAFVCELKRRDHTKSTWQPGQENYLIISQNHGAFACIALGADAATEALNEWLAILTN